MKVIECAICHEPVPWSVTGLGMQSTGMVCSGLAQMTQARGLNNHLPIQEKPGLRPDIWSHSQVTNVT